MSQNVTLNQYSKYFLFSIIYSFSPAKLDEIISNICSPYRSKALKNQKIPIYYGIPSDNLESFYMIDVWFDSEYEYIGGMAGLPRPDGLPKRDLLFDINIDDGKPLSLEFRNSANPKTKGFFTLLLLGGVNHLPLSRVLNSFANAPYGASLGKVPTIVRTGELISGMGRIDIPSYIPDKGETAPGHDWYAEISESGEFTALMRCNISGTVPIPHCRLHEKFMYFEGELSSFRRDQLDKLHLIRHHAKNFTTCLTWSGK
ncbi:MAG: hypothetical protein LCH38_14140 [Proteobacteria bacterium]|nr:hypothetical protein [Pseudomonadota bacterium]